MIVGPDLVRGCGIFWVGSALGLSTQEVSANLLSSFIGFCKMCAIFL